jgi:integral membrane protein (TIGR01906 family)
MPLARLTITALVPVLLVLGGVRLLLTESYLRLEYGKPDFPADAYGFTTEDRLRYAPFALRYLLNGEGSAYLADLRLPDGAPLFTAREVKHMDDVKTVVQAAMIALTVGAALFVVLSALLWRTEAGRAALRGGLLSGAVLMLAALGGLVVYVLLDWDHFFDSFHNLFFAEGTWRFAYSDSLLRLFPIRFWQDAALTLGGLCAAAALLILAVAWRWTRRAL